MVDQDVGAAEAVRRQVDLLDRMWKFVRLLALPILVIGLVFSLTFNNASLNSRLDHSDKVIDAQAQVITAQTQFFCGVRSLLVAAEQSSQQPPAVQQALKTLEAAPLNCPPGS